QFLPSPERTSPTPNAKNTAWVALQKAFHICSTRSKPDSLPVDFFGIRRGRSSLRTRQELNISLMQFHGTASGKMAKDYGCIATIRHYLNLVITGGQVSRERSLTTNPSYRCAIEENFRSGGSTADIQMRRLLRF